MRRLAVLVALLVLACTHHAYGYVAKGAGAGLVRGPQVAREPHGLDSLARVAPKKRTPVRKPLVAAYAPSRTYDTSGVEQWRPLVQRYFGANTDAALSVMRKESGGNPNARNTSSGASGLFQQMPQYWEARITRAEEVYGREFSHNIFDPEANIAASAVLSSGGSNWSHWVAKP